MNTPWILLPFILFSVNVLLADDQFDESHWLSDHQGFNELASKNVNDSLDKAVESIVNKLIEDEKGRKQSIAVSEFLTKDNQMTMLGKIISIKLVKALAKSGKFNSLAKDFAFIVTGDMKNGLTTLIDDKTVQGAGNLLGVSHVLLGAIDVAGEDVVIVARLIDMEKSAVQSAAQASFESGPGIKHLLEYKIELDPLDPSEKKSIETSASKMKPITLNKPNYYEAHYMLDTSEKKKGVDDKSKGSWEKSHHITVFTPKGYKPPFKSFHQHE